jgi:hypothetical protein
MVGILLVDWSTIEAVAWPSTACYRLFRKAPPWVFWKAIPVALQLLEHCLKMYQLSTWVVSTCFGLALRVNERYSLSFGKVEENTFGDCIEEPTFPEAHQHCLAAASINSHSDSTKQQAQSVLINSGLERDNCPITFDTGASRCLNGVRSDFLEFFPEGAQHSVIKGIAQDLDIEGEGMVE